MRDRPGAVFGVGRFERAALEPEELGAAVTVGEAPVALPALGRLAVRAVRGVVGRVVAGERRRRGDGVGQGHDRDGERPSGERRPAGDAGEHALPGAQVRVPLQMMNRHGLVAGATGTGKTKTLQVLAASDVPALLRRRFEEKDGTIGTVFAPRVRV